MIDPVVSMQYMLAGYTVICVVLVIYLLSLFVRTRNLKRQLQMLEDEPEDKH